MTVDLNVCIEGQKLLLRNGQVISYAKRICCADGNYYHAALHNGRVLTYTDEGSYCFDGKEDIRDVIEILPLETTEPPKAASHPIVDLNTCVRGQICVTKQGERLTYVNRRDSSIYYPHLLLDEDSSEQTFTSNGMFSMYNPNSERNIVRIIPVQSTTPDQHPSVAWWDSCPWITDRRPIREDGDHLGQVIVQTVSKQGRKLDLSFMQWNYVLSGRAWIHGLDWQPPVLSNKEKASKLLAKHKDSSATGVWVPTPEQWNIIRAGLED